MRYKIFICLLSVTFLALNGCRGGDSGNNGLSVSSLKGNWAGALRDSNQQNVYSLTLTIDQSGNINNVVLGNTPQQVTGTISKTGDNTFSFSLSDGTKGGFFADNTGNHIGLIDDGYSYGIIQKNASTTLPAYSDSDVIGSWSGYSVDLGSDLSLLKTYSSSATINSDGTFSGNTPDGSFQGTMVNVYLNIGYFTGTWNSAGGSGNVLSWVLQDKTIMMSWACDSGYASELTIYNTDYCSFSMWTKS